MEAGEPRNKNYSFNLYFVTDFVDCRHSLLICRCKEKNNYRTVLLIFILFSPLFTYFSLPDFFISLTTTGTADFRDICQSLKTAFHRSKHNAPTHHLTASAVLLVILKNTVQLNIGFVRKIYLSCSAVLTDQAPYIIQYHKHI